MIPFEHTGHQSQRENRFRSVFLEIVMGVLAVLVLPFTLLGVCLAAVWDLASPRQASR